jgi:hypothetical protein
MKRPDEILFLQHTERFKVVDRALTTFCSENGFTLDINLHRTPCRVMRRAGNPEVVLDFYLDGNWQELDDMDNLRYTFAVAGYYVAPENTGVLLKLEAVLGDRQSFGMVCEKLSEYLDAGLRILDSWTISEYQTKGTKLENLRMTMS